MAKKRLRPKRTCCDDKPKCTRCPLRMLKEGTLPAGYTVKRRKLVKVEKATVKGGNVKGGKAKGGKAA